MSKFWNGIKDASSSTSSPASSVGCHDAAADCDVFHADGVHGRLASSRLVRASCAATATPTAQATCDTASSSRSNSESSTSEQSTPSSTTPTVAHAHDSGHPDEPAPATVAATAPPSSRRTDSQSAATRPETVPPSRPDSARLSSTTTRCPSPLSQSASTQSTSPRGSSSAISSPSASGSTRFARLPRRDSADLSCLPEEAPPQAIPSSTASSPGTSGSASEAAIPAAPASTAGAASVRAYDTTALIDPPAQDVGISSALPTAGDNPNGQQQQQQQEEEEKRRQQQQEEEPAPPLSSAPGPPSNLSTSATLYHSTSSASSAQSSYRAGHSMPGSRLAAHDAPLNRNGPRARPRHSSSSLTRAFSSRSAASVAGPPPMLNRMTSAPDQGYARRMGHTTQQPQSPGELMLLFLLERMCSRAQGSRGYQVYLESIMALKSMGILDANYIPNLSERYRRAFAAVFSDVQDRVDLRSDVGHLDAAPSTTHTAAPTLAPTAGPGMHLMPQSSFSSPSSPTSSTHPLCVTYTSAAHPRSTGPPPLPADPSMALGSGPLSVYTAAPAAAIAAASAHMQQQQQQQQQQHHHQEQRMYKRFHQEFVDHEALGTGGFGTVYRARHKIDKCWYALKAIPLPQYNADNVVSEAEILSRISHKHIVSYKTTWVEVDDGTLHIPENDVFEEEEEVEAYGDEGEGDEDGGKEPTDKHAASGRSVRAVLAGPAPRACDSDGADTILDGGDADDADDASDLELEEVLTFRGMAHPGTSSDNACFTAGTNDDSDTTDDDWSSTFSSEDEPDEGEPANDAASAQNMGSEFFQHPGELSCSSVGKHSIGEAHDDNERGGSSTALGEATVANSTTCTTPTTTATAAASATATTAPTATRAGACRSTPPIVRVCQCSVTSPPRVGQPLGTIPLIASHSSSPRIYLLSSEDGATPAVGQRSRNTSIDSLKSFDASHPAPSPSASSNAGVRRVNPKRPSSTRADKRTASFTTPVKVDAETSAGTKAADGKTAEKVDTTAPQRNPSDDATSAANEADPNTSFLESSLGADTSNNSNSNNNSGDGHGDDEGDDDHNAVDDGAEEKENRAGSLLRGTTSTTAGAEFTCESTPPPQTPPRPAANTVPATPPRQPSLCMVCGRVRAPMHTGAFAGSTLTVGTTTAFGTVDAEERGVAAAARQTSAASNASLPSSRRRVKKKKTKKKTKKKRSTRNGSSSNSKTTGSLSTVAPRRVLGDVNQIDPAVVDRESKWLVPFRKQPDIPPPKLCLFIQMELCQTNLHAWLREQWKEEAAGPVISRTELPQRMNILQQLLAAISYLHSQKLIHRDIKPQNVLLNKLEDGSLHVLLGDLGLARVLYSAAGHGPQSTGNTSAAQTQPGSTGVSSAVGTPPRSDATNDATNDPLWTPSPRGGSASCEPAPAFVTSPRGQYRSGSNSARFTPRHSGSGVRRSRARNQYLQDKLSVVAAQQEQQQQLQEGRRPHHNHISDLHAYAYNRSELTKGLGTETYSSPEQLAGNTYDDRADMYSVGIIILELMCNFGTEMERGLKIRDLKRGRPPLEFMEQHSVQCSWAMGLVSKDPKRRLSSQQLLDIVQEFDSHLEEEEEHGSNNTEADNTDEDDADADDVQHTILKSKATIAHYQDQLQQREDDLRKHAEERETLQDQVHWLLDKVESLEKEVRDKQALEIQNRDLRYRVDRQGSVIRRLKSRLVQQQSRQQQDDSEAP